MRRSAALLAGLALATGTLTPAAASTASPASPASPGSTAGTSSPEPGVAAYALVPAQVFGDVAVGLPNKRTVKIQHRDPATGAWDAPSTLYKAKGKVTCGDLEGQSSPGGVALLLECDTPYFEENAPVHSLALVSRDGRTWTGRTLDGEAYQQPAIAPSGAYAAWLVGGGGHYLLWSASTGFADADTTYGYDSGGETLVVDDAGTVSVIGPQSAGQDCVVGVHSRDLAGQRTSSVVGGVDPGCVEGQFENISALSVTGGLYGAAQRFTISRADTASPWVLTSGRPADAPGLVSYARPNRQITTSFLETSDPARPLVAVGGPDHHRVLAQVFDAAAQTWGAQTPIWSSPRRCRAGDDYSFAPRAIYVFAVRCGRKQTVLASPDAATWTVGQVGRRAWTYAEGRVALPDRTGTTVVSPTGVQRYGVTTGGPCDVVYPAAGQLVRLHGGPWPRKVQVSTGGRFATVSRSRPARERCVATFVSNAEEQPDISLLGRRTERSVRFVLREGTWRVVSSRHPST